MTKSTTSAANETAAVISQSPAGSATAKPTRKRCMAREPGKVLATPPGTSTATLEAEIDATPSVSPPLPSAPNKTTTIPTLLHREDGATLDEMIDATGWLPHTTRALLTGLRKKGHVIERGKRDGVTIWRIAGEA